MSCRLILYYVSPLRGLVKFLIIITTNLSALRAFKHAALPKIYFLFSYASNPHFNHSANSAGSGV